MATLQSRKYTKGEYKDQTVNMPVVGTVKFNKDGTLDVEDELVDEFIRLTEESFDFATPEVKEEEDEAKKLKEAEKKELAENLEKMDIVALSELLDDAGIKREDAAKWTDKKLRKELLKKLAV